MGWEGAGEASKREAAAEEEGAGVEVGEVEFPKRPMMSSTAEREEGGGAEEVEELSVEEGPDPKMSARRSLVDWAEAAAEGAEEEGVSEGSSSPMRSRRDDWRDRKGIEVNK